MAALGAWASPEDCRPERLRSSGGRAGTPAAPLPTGRLLLDGRPSVSAVPAPRFSRFAEAGSRAPEPRWGSPQRYAGLRRHRGRDRRAGARSPLPAALPRRPGDAWRGRESSPGESSSGPRGSPCASLQPSRQQSRPRGPHSAEALPQPSSSLERPWSPGDGPASPASPPATLAPVRRCCHRRRGLVRQCSPCRMWCEMDGCPPGGAWPPGAAEGSWILSAPIGARRGS